MVRFILDGSSKCRFASGTESFDGLNGVLLSMACGDIGRLNW